MPNWCDNSVTLYNEDVEKVSTKKKTGMNGI